MSGHEDRLTAVADAAHQFPDRPPRLRVEPCGQLIQKYHFRIVDQRQSDEQPLLLPAGKGHEPGVPFVGEAELFQQPIAVHGFRVQRGPQIHRLPDLDPLLELRLLELHSNTVLQLIHVAERIQAQDRDGAAVRPAHSFDALHRGCLPCAVRTDQAEDFAFADFKRNLGDGHRRPVGLADAGNLDDWTRSRRTTFLLRYQENIRRRCPPNFTRAAAPSSDQFGTPSAPAHNRLESRRSAKSPLPVSAPADHWLSFRKEKIPPAWMWLKPSAH